MLIDSIKNNEDAGFKSGGYPYKDHLGYDTIGYGTKLPLSEEECSLLLKHRLDIVNKELVSKKHIVQSLPADKQRVLLEMAYQLGVPTLMKFKKMWKALELGAFKEAAKEMLDSKWHKQTPSRAERLAHIMSA